jgi:TonB-dependent SusC/RagA subfamily outer membrane receptor
MHTNKLKYLFLFWNILFLTISINAQQPDTTKQITGKALDASTGSGLAGVTVSVPGFSSVITNDSGYFALKVPDFSATLSINGMGYKTKEVALKGQTSVSFSMYEESYTSIYDKAFLPQGPITMNRTINAVSSLNFGLDAWKQSGETPEKDLQGKIAGLSVVSRSGMPGAGADLYLRGYTSLYATNHPLVIVDGMIYDMNENSNSIINNYFTNPLSNIDPRDIDNITVIKDASSIYGSKAGNGIICITTSHAKEQATKIDFNASGGINYAPKQYPLLDADNYRIYLSDMLKTNALTDAQIQSLP